METAVLAPVRLPLTGQVRFVPRNDQQLEFTAREVRLAARLFDVDQRAVRVMDVELGADDGLAGRGGRVGRFEVGLSRDGDERVAVDAHLVERQSLVRRRARREREGVGAYLARQSLPVRLRQDARVDRQHAAESGHRRLHRRGRILREQPL